MIKIKCIIPCAGFGTRVNMKPNQSKEMLPDPGYKRQPIIQFALDMCKTFNLEPLVITREDKKDLRQYLFNANINFIDIKVEGEWYDSVLKSSNYWNNHNILLLPDTRFTPLRCLQDLKNGLELGNESVFALHKVNEPNKWGIIKDYQLLEKPKDLIGEQWAWGAIGFTKTMGEFLFKDNFIKILDNTGFTYFTKFEDITRGKK